MWARTSPGLSATLPYEGRAWANGALTGQAPTSLSSISFRTYVRTRQIGWRLKSRLNGLAALRHEVRLRGLPRTQAHRALVGGRVSATCAGRFRGRRPFRRGFNRPRRNVLSSWERARGEVRRRDQTSRIASRLGADGTVALAEMRSAVAI